MRAFLFLALLLFAVPATAQQPPICSSAEFEELRTDIINILTDEIAFDRLNEWLTAASAAIEMTRWNCAAAAYTSEEFGLQPVIGPIMLSSGLYRVRFTTEAAGIVELISAGGCSDQLLFAITTGRALPPGAQTTVRVVDRICEYYVQISNTRTPWTLEFERLSPNR